VRDVSSASRAWSVPALNGRSTANRNETTANDRLLHVLLLHVLLLHVLLLRVMLLQVMAQLPLGWEYNVSARAQRAKRALN
jgi:hypothetical protein